MRDLILETRQRVAQTVNAGLTLLYWQIGFRIRQDILEQKRAEYGAEIVQALSGQFGWRHFQRIIYLDDSLKRDFYAERSGLIFSCLERRLKCL